MASIFDGFDLSSSLNDFKQTTGTAMSKVKDETLTPMSVSSEKMQEGVALLKPTDTSVTGVISDYRSTAVSELDGIIGMLSGGLLNTKDLTRSVRVGRDGVGIDTDSLLAAASEQIGFPVTGKNSAMRKLSNAINDQFAKLTGVNIGDLITNDQKGFSVNGNWRTMLGQETLNQVSKLTGINEFIDVSLQTAIYNSVMDSAAQLGMRDSYKSIYDLYSNKRSAKEMLIDAVRVMITNGDIESIDVVVNILDQDGVNSVNAAYPNLVEDLFRSFSFNDSLTPQDYPPLKIKLLGLLNRICGPNWWLKSTAFGNAYNLGIVNNVSADMIILLDGDNDLAPLLCSAGIFTQRNAISELKLNFKDAPVYTA